MPYTKHEARSTIYVRVRRVECGVQGVLTKEDGVAEYTEFQRVYFTCLPYLAYLPYVPTSDTER